MFLFPVFDFIAKNRWAQWILIGIATIATLGFYLAWRDGGVRKRERQRAEAETITVVNGIKEKSIHDADEAVAAGAAVPQYDRADDIPVDVAGRIFRD